MYITKCFFVFALVLFTVGCSEDDDPQIENSDPFFGRWEIVSATGSFADDNIGTIYEFKEDGTVSLTGDGITTNATFDRTSNQLTIDFSGIELIYTYILSGQRLTLDNTTSDQVFMLEKR